MQQANERKIPLITSDEGSNKNGGAFAIGVIEADIGRQGAKMAAELLLQGSVNAIASRICEGFWSLLTKRLVYLRA